jgi:hypothetical protein
MVCTSFRQKMFTTVTFVPCSALDFMGLVQSLGVAAFSEGVSATQHSVTSYRKIIEST